MTNQTLCELFILFLDFIASARIFFLKRVKRDYLSAIPVYALFLCVGSVFAFGLNISLLIVLIVSVSTFFWNFRALLRFNAKLVVDHYSNLFITASIFTFILSGIAFIYIFVNAPIKTDFKKSGVQFTKTEYTGNYTYGFSKVQSARQLTTGILYEFTKLPEPRPRTEDEWKNRVPKIGEFFAEQFSTNPKVQTIMENYPYPKTITEPVKYKGTVLFLPDKSSTPELFFPFFNKLARDNFKVYSGEFFSRDLKNFNSTKDFKSIRHFHWTRLKTKHPENYDAMIEKNEIKIANEIKTLIQLSGVKEEDTVYLIVDYSTKEPAKIAMMQEGELIDGIFDLSTVSGYSAGYGPIEQTSPILAKYLHKKKDKTLYMSAHLANDFQKSILN